jgi:predicted Zn-dependent protease
MFAAATLLACLATPQAWAWSKLRSARAALNRHRPGEARDALRSCQRVWGDRPSVRLLASRAAWQDGDPETALTELRAAQRLEGTATQETAFEWALIQASAGNLSEVEQYLQARADQSPDEAGPLVWEALATGYLRVYRTLDAMACLNHWLKAEPDNVRALELRGQTYVAGRGVVRGAEDFRRVVELDPSRDATRQGLIDALLSLGGYEDAAAHLERIAPDHPDDPKLKSQLARCYAMLGHNDRARRLAEDAVAKYPDNPLCLRTLGQIDLLSRRLDEAERHLRQAARLAPEDYQSQQLLHQALLQQGKFDEARAQLATAETVRERQARIGELTSRKLAEYPLDAAVHYEMGKLLIESGSEAGESWLLNALVLDPEHIPSHAALADFYLHRGEKEKADYHRARANAPKK